jgi:predicted small lipoprotein YifL
MIVVRSWVKLGVILVLAVTFGLGACGKKGPLYLPDGQSPAMPGAPLVH